MNNESVYNGKGSEILPTLVYQNEKGVDVTTSLIVAQVFGKEHNKVCRDIENLSCSTPFRVANFGDTPYVHPQNGQTYKMYTMTKDGFSFLVMGYTGEKAGEFKEKFINEFNQREMMLKSEDYILMRSMQILQDRVKAIEANNERLRAENEFQNRQLQEAAPKVQYVNNVLQSVNTYTSTQLSKELGMREAEQLHKALKEKGIMFKQSGQWMLTAKYSEKGYTKPRTTTYTRSDGSQGTNTITVWTEKGRAFLHKVFTPKEQSA